MSKQSWDDLENPDTLRALLKELIVKHDALDARAWELKDHVDFIRRVLIADNKRRAGQPPPLKGKK